MKQPAVLLIVMGILCVAGTALADETVIFDGTLYHGKLWADHSEAQAEIAKPDSADDSPDDEAVIRLSYDQPWRSAGLAFFGQQHLLVPEGAIVLRVRCRVKDRDTPAAMKVETDAGTQRFDEKLGAWRVDGKPGAWSRFKPGVWHTVDLDLTSLDGFTPGKTRLTGQVAMTSGAGAEDAFIEWADVRLVSGDAAAEHQPSATQPPGTQASQAARPSAETNQTRREVPSVRITIHPENLQEVEHWGIATQNRPDWGKQWAIVNYPESVNALYGELGATIVRFGIDYRTFDNIEACKALRDGVLAATSRGLAWYATPWSPPPAMKTINNPNGEVGGKPNGLIPGRERDVARWLVDLTTWLRDEHVPLPVGLSPQNEPDFGPAWYPGCVYPADQLRTLVIALREELDAAGLDTVTVVADEGAKPGAFPNQADADKGTINLSGIAPGGAYHTSPDFRSALGVLSTHTYDLHNGLYKANPGYMYAFAEAAEALGIPVWMTEWETRHEHTQSDWEVLTETFRHFNRDMSIMRFNAWMHWQVWRSELVTPAPEDVGDAVRRIRAGDTLIYRGVKIPGDADGLTLRYAVDSDRMKVEVRLDRPDAPPIVETRLAKTGARRFSTLKLDAPLGAKNAERDLFIRFTSADHWREASLNWFEIAGQRTEAESFNEKQTVEHWSSRIEPAYYAGTRRLFLHDDGETLQRRPLYYLFQKVWTHAPAGKGTFVRRVTTDRPDVVRGDTGEHVPASYRQDVSAFVHAGATTLLLINDQDHDISATIEGLEGRQATVFRYTQADASTVNVPMHEAGHHASQDGTLARLRLPAKTISVIVSSDGNGP